MYLKAQMDRLLSRTVTGQGEYQIPSVLCSQALNWPNSTSVGDHEGIPAAVRFFFGFHTYDGLQNVAIPIFFLFSLSQFLVVIIRAHVHVHPPHSCVWPTSPRLNPS